VQNINNKLPLYRCINQYPNPFHKNPTRCPQLNNPRPPSTFPIYPNQTNLPPSIFPCITTSYYIISSRVKTITTFLISLPIPTGWSLGNLGVVFCPSWKRVVFGAEGPLGGRICDARYTGSFCLTFWALIGLGIIQGFKRLFMCGIYGRGLLRVGFCNGLLVMIRLFVRIFYLVL